MKKWDVFVSHASEDKEAVALPLTESLVRSGLKVWLDQFELTIGDSLREKIDQGLSESTFGVVILSKSFLKKRWPKNELNGLFALEEDGTKVILPVWHGLNREKVAGYSPMIADRLAANTKDGIPAVAQQIVRVVMEEATKLKPGAGSLASRFLEILTERHSPVSVSTFLTKYEDILHTRLGIIRLLQVGLHRLPAHLGAIPIQPDLAYGIRGSTLGEWTWINFIFCPAYGPLFNEGRPNALLNQAIDRLQHLLQWLSDHRKDAAKVFEGESYNEYDGIILAGRRVLLSDVDRQGIRSLKENGVIIRTYDWLVEACAAVDRMQSRSSDVRRQSVL